MFLFFSFIFSLDRVVFMAMHFVKIYLGVYKIPKNYPLLFVPIWSIKHILKAICSICLLSAEIPIAPARNLVSLPSLCFFCIHWQEFVTTVATSFCWLPYFCSWTLPVLGWQCFFSLNILQSAVSIGQQPCYHGTGSELLARSSSLNNRKKF